MEINNLSASPTLKKSKPNTKINFIALGIVVVLALSSGFVISRFFPVQSHLVGFTPNSSNDTTNESTIKADDISSTSDIEVGKVYGNSGKNYTDSATGTIEKGSLNGEGTHILNREGGSDQRAALTSSSVDLDLFVGRKVEVKGETNSSKKVGWLLDVGSVKVLE